MALDKKISLVIFGSRNISPSMREIDKGLAILLPNLESMSIHEIICGMATGVDAAGRVWAINYGIPVRPFHAKWSSLGKYAGHERNARMADEATHALGFWHDNSPGTANMAALMLVRRKPIVLIKWTPNLGGLLPDSTV